MADRGMRNVSTVDDLQYHYHQHRHDHYLHHISDGPPPTPIRERRVDEQSLPLFNQVIKYVIPSLLALVLLKYQGNPGFLFAGYPAPAVWCFVASLCAYWILVTKLKQQMPPVADTKYFGVLIHAALASGLLSALSLLSLLLPLKVSFAPHLIWVLVPLILGWLAFYATYICLHTATTSALHPILANLFRPRCVGNLIIDATRLPV